VKKGLFIKIKNKEKYKKAVHPRTYQISPSKSQIFLFPLFLLVLLGHPDGVAGPRSWRHTAWTVLSTIVGIAVLWVALSALGGA